MRKSHECGFGLIEMLIGGAILSVSLLAISGFFRSAIDVSERTKNSVKANYLLEEGMEIMKILRDTSFTGNIKNLAVGSPYYFSWNSGNSTWATSTTNVFVDNKFERKFTVANVSRSTLTGATKDDIVSSGGANDPDTKLITVTVAYSHKGATTTKSLQAYVTNIFSN